MPTSSATPVAAGTALPSASRTSAGELPNFREVRKSSWRQTHTPDVSAQTQERSGCLFSQPVVRPAPEARVSSRDALRPDTFRTPEIEAPVKP